jgi:hypothetical protein
MLGVVVVTVVVLAGIAAVVSSPAPQSVPVPAERAPARARRSVPGP